MAYLNPVAGKIGMMAAVGCPSANARFDHTEWHVIMLARHDGLESLRAPSRIVKLLHWIFGGGRNRQLANPRLESLRKIAVRAWRMGHLVPTTIIKCATDAGFSAAQIDTLLTLVTVDACPSKRLAACCVTHVQCRNLQEC